jgi:uncharacterized protein
MLLGLSLSLFMGVVLGLLGGGGSILALPIFVHAFGLSAREAIPMSLLVVGLTAAAGVIPRLRAHQLCWRSAALLLGSSTTGAWFGGRISSRIDTNLLMLVFAAAMVAAGISMWRDRKINPSVADPKFGSAGWMLMGGLGAGLLTGLVGAGGGFLLVPLLMRLRGMSQQTASGTSLLVIVLNSMAGFIGQIETQPIHLNIALLASSAAMLGAVLGAVFAERLATPALRRGFALLMFGATFWVACPILCHA